MGIQMILILENKTDSFIHLCVHFEPLFGCIGIPQIKY